VPLLSQVGLCWDPFLALKHSPIPAQTMKSLELLDHWFPICVKSFHETSKHFDAFPLYHVYAHSTTIFSDDSFASVLLGLLSPCPLIDFVKS
jgi:hypothetical protein